MSVLGSIFAAGATEAVCTEVACRAGSGATEGCWLASLEAEAKLPGTVDLLAGVRGAGAERKTSTTWQKITSGGRITNGYLTCGLSVAVDRLGSSLLEREYWGHSMLDKPVAILVEVHQHST